MRFFAGILRFAMIFLRFRRCIGRLVVRMSFVGVGFVRMLLVRMSVFLPGVRRFVARTPFTASLAAGRFLRIRLAGRLDAAERAAEIVQLAFIGQFLPLGNFNQFQNLVDPVNQLLERLGNFRRVDHGLVDRRCVGGAEISGLHPGFRTRRFRSALQTNRGGPDWTDRFCGHRLWRRSFRSSNLRSSNGR